MPPKRKDDSTAGRLPKRSKPTFRAPITVPNDTTTSQASSSRNRIVTLRTNSTGRRGYRTQDVISNPGSNPDSDSSASPNFIDPLPAQDASDLGSVNINNLNTNTDTLAKQTKSRRKKKNTTTVGCIDT
jgi:hypothetical protein